MSKYRGLYTFDTDNHKYVTLAQADGIIDLLDTDDYVPPEPLIKDPKIRKAVRAWAEANYSKFITSDGYYTAGDDSGHIIEFGGKWTRYMEDGKQYTITELCGEEQE